jgi:hypothetical protein
VDEIEERIGIIVAIGEDMAGIQAGEERAQHARWDDGYGYIEISLEATRRSQSDWIGA